MGRGHHQRRSTPNRLSISDSSLHFYRMRRYSEYRSTRRPNSPVKKNLAPVLPTPNDRGSIRGCRNNSLWVMILTYFSVGFGYLGRGRIPSCSCKGLRSLFESHCHPHAVSVPWFESWLEYAGFEHLLDLNQTVAPGRHVVEKAEAENGIRALAAEREAGGVADVSGGKRMMPI